MSQQGEEFDTIIVGGGSAGCVAANRLVMAGQRVLIIERGLMKARGLAGFYLPMPAAWTKGIVGSDIVELHTPIPQVGLNGRAPAVGQGNILGGGSAVNAMVYKRGQREDYDAWDTFLGAGSGWSYEDVLPHFTSMECNHRFNDDYHGANGPLHVSDPGHICDLSEAFVLTLQGMGVRFNPDFNGRSQDGVGYMQYTIKNGRRCSAVDAFLRNILENPLLTIWTDTPVTRVVVEKGRAVGVVCTRNGDHVKVHAANEVLLAAGSYNTPKLLMLSGIGSADAIRAHGVIPTHDLPGVGQNLQDHHEVPVVASTKRNSGYYGQDRGWKMLLNGLQYILFGTGPVTTIGVEACAYFDPDGSERPKMVMYCVPGIYLDGDVEGIAGNYGVTLNACLLRPKSRGSVTLRSADPKDMPVVDNRYLADPEDLRLELAGLRYAREILAQRPLADFVLEELLPKTALTDDAALANHCRKTVKTNWHPVGTCRMGRDNDPLAVLDKDLRLRGVEKLRVIDASAMPFIPSGNTNAPTMALASNGIAKMLGTDVKEKKLPAHGRA